jgi:hypothetical protein
VEATVSRSIRIPLGALRWVDVCCSVLSSGRRADKGSSADTEARRPATIDEIVRPESLDEQEETSLDSESGLADADRNQPEFNELARVRSDFHLLEVRILSLEEELRSNAELQAALTRTKRTGRRSRGRRRPAKPSDRAEQLGALQHQLQAELGQLVEELEHVKTEIDRLEGLKQPVVAPVEGEHNHEAQVGVRTAELTPTPPAMHSAVQGAVPFPIDAYEDLLALEVHALLDELDLHDLELVRQREQRGKRRTLVLCRIDRLLGRLA